MPDPDSDGKGLQAGRRLADGTPADPRKMAAIEAVPWARPRVEGDAEMSRISPITRHLLCLGLCALVPAMASCSSTALSALISPRSNFDANAQLVSRAVQVAFINNTPFRAVFSFGAYNPLDQETIPSSSRQLRLEGNTASPQFAQPCLQAFSVGGDELIRLIRKNEPDPTVNVTDPRALVNGVNFSGAVLGDPLEAEPTEGTALGSVVFSGVDFNCERTDIRDPGGATLLLFTFEQDATAPGGFRIDFSFFAE